MQSDWASQNLQTIRTLMERSAVYRRALAPLMTLLGLTGLAAAVAGHFLRFQDPRPWTAYWMSISIVSLIAALLLVRRQALNAAEPFWSPPTRRVGQAMLPALFAGLVLGLSFLVFGARNPVPGWLIVPGWIVLYGCALHSAGFFMPRGIKLFGWAFVVCGSLLALLPLGQGQSPDLVWANALMGAFFGGAHFAYGVYLYFTENRRNGP